eukprot:1157592-Rhodomonas_salina.1
MAMVSASARALWASCDRTGESLAASISVHAMLITSSSNPACSLSLSESHRGPGRRLDVVCP